ncbi:MAG: hypothetical protein NTX50_27790 [Candidatus Sumerlaeota bacterium]|nr:hypothetical protein [Candidatus Sumerlaeota bacterium]
MWNRAMSVIASLMTVAVLALVAAAQAQQPGAAAPAPGESRVVMDWKEFKAISKFDEARLESDKDKFVIPWQDVKNLFGIEIKDVNTAELKLPWKEFKTLLEWSIKEADRKKKEAEKDEPAPVPYLINSVEFVGDNLKADGAMFKATYKIDVFEKKGWKKIMVLPGEVAVKTATLPAGVFLQLENKSYNLLTKNAESITVTIEFSVAVTEAMGSSMLSFTKPAASTCILDVTVPEKNVDVKIAGAQSKLSKQEADKTHVVAALPADSRVNVTWERAIPEVEKVPPKIFSETRTLISVADGILLGHSQVSFNILHTATRQLTLNVPEGVNILEVTAPNMRDWRSATGKLNLSLAKEVIGSYVVDVKYETALPAASEKVSIPVLTASGVELEKGQIGVEALTNVEIGGDVAEAAHTIDVKDLAPEIPGMTAQPILLAYRYVMPTFKIGLKIGKHENVAILLTVIDSAYFTVMQTLDGRRITKGIYNVRNNRNQFLRLKMPEGA